ncbi:unnamed protein product [Rotaria socialis]
MHQSIVGCNIRHNNIEFKIFQLFLMRTKNCSIIYILQQNTNFLLDILFWLQTLFAFRDEKAMYNNIVPVCICIGIRKQCSHTIYKSY